MTTHDWPELNYAAWKDTLDTLQRWVQIVGKIRLSKTPWVNHGWNSCLYVTERGLTTSVIHDRHYSFAIDFDFVSQLLQFSRSDGETRAIRLTPKTVAGFHAECLGALFELECPARISNSPNELADATPFSQDQQHRTYDPDSAQRYWRALLQADRVLKIFRSGFVGKASPVHFFWGGFDLAATRFSGRRAPEHPGGFPHLSDLVTREAYSHEVSSCGFWPGNSAFPKAAFYSYAYPIPPLFEKARLPKGGYFEESLKEFILPYNTVRESSSPDDLLLDFLKTTYDAAADLGHWDRAALEDSPYLKALQARHPRAA